MIPDQGIFKWLFDWAWGIVALLVGILWRKHNDEMDSLKNAIKHVNATMDKHVQHFDAQLDSIKQSKVPRDAYEQNRKEVREGQIAIYNRLDALGQAIGRIEGKLDK